MIRKLFTKYKEPMLYLIFGVLTTVVSIASYWAFIHAGINALISNVLSWIVAVTFAFFTNRIWVFHAPTSSIKDFFKQMVSFFGARVATLVLEEGIILVFVTILHWNSMGVKTVAQVVVIVLNYVLSKLVVFRR